MMDSWTATQRRGLALGLLACVLALAWLAIVSPILDYAGTGAAERDAALRTLSRNRALLAQAPLVDSALASVEQSARWGRLYDGQKAEKATLQLETDLRALFNTPNTLTSMVAIAPLPQGPLTRIAVKVTLSMPIDQFSEALSRLQSHPKLLQLETLTVQAPDYQASDTNPMLAVQAQIVGFMLTKALAGT